MKAALAIALAILVSAGAVAGVYLSDEFRATQVSTSSSSCSDPASINSHVYHPYRLQFKSCITASGIVANVADELLPSGGEAARLLPGALILSARLEQELGELDEMTAPAPLYPNWFSARTADVAVRDALKSLAGA